MPRLKDRIQQPAVTGQADPEYQTRIEAQRCTLEFAQKIHQPLNRGQRPMSESPLFGGEAQTNMFGGVA